MVVAQRHRCAVRLLRGVESAAEDFHSETEDSALGPIQPTAVIGAAIRSECVLVLPPKHHDCELLLSASEVGQSRQHVAEVTARGESQSNRTVESSVRKLGYFLLDCGYTIQSDEGTLLTHLSASHAQLGHDMLGWYCNGYLPAVVHRLLGFDGKLQGTEAATSSDTPSYPGRRSECSKFSAPFLSSLSPAARQLERNVNRNASTHMEQDPAKTPQEAADRTPLATVFMRWAAVRSVTSAVIDLVDPFLPVSCAFGIGGAPSPAHRKAAPPPVDRRNGVRPETDAPHSVALPFMRGNPIFGVTEAYEPVLQTCANEAIEKPERLGALRIRSVHDFREHVIRVLATPTLRRHRGELSFVFWLRAESDPGSPCGPDNDGSNKDVTATSAVVCLAVEKHHKAFLSALRGDHAPTECVPQVPPLANRSGVSFEDLMMAVRHSFQRGRNAIAAAPFVVFRLPLHLASDPLGAISAINGLAGTNHPPSKNGSDDDGEGDRSEVSSCWGTTESSLWEQLRDLRGLSNMNPLSTPAPVQPAPILSPLAATVLTRGSRRPRVDCGPLCRGPPQHATPHRARGVEPSTSTATASARTGSTDARTRLRSPGRATTSSRPAIFTSHQSPSTSPATVTESLSLKRVGHVIVKGLGEEEEVPQQQLTEFVTHDSDVFVLPLPSETPAAFPRAARLLWHPPTIASPPQASGSGISISQMPDSTESEEPAPFHRITSNSQTRSHPCVALADMQLPPHPESPNSVALPLTLHKHRLPFCEPEGVKAPSGEQAEDPEKAFYQLKLLQELGGGTASAKVGKAESSSREQPTGKKRKLHCFQEQRRHAPDSETPPKDFSGSSPAEHEAEERNPSTQVRHASATWCPSPSMHTSTLSTPDSRSPGTAHMTEVSHQPPYGPSAAMTEPQLSELPLFGTVEHWRKLLAQHHASTLQRLEESMRTLHEEWERCESERREKQLQLQHRHDQRMALERGRCEELEAERAKLEAATEQCECKAHELMLNLLIADDGRPAIQRIGSEESPLEVGEAQCSRLESELSALFDEVTALREQLATTKRSTIQLRGKNARSQQVLEAKRKLSTWYDGQSRQWQRYRCASDEAAARWEIVADADHHRLLLYSRFFNLLRTLLQHQCCVNGSTDASRGGDFLSARSADSEPTDSALEAPPVNHSDWASPSSPSTPWEAHATHSTKHRLGAGADGDGLSSDLQIAPEEYSASSSRSSLRLLASHLGRGLSTKDGVVQHGSSYQVTSQLSRDIEAARAQYRETQREIRALRDDWMNLKKKGLEELKTLEEHVATSSPTALAALTVSLKQTAGRDHGISSSESAQPQLPCTVQAEYLPVLLADGEMAELAAGVFRSFHQCCAASEAAAVAQEKLAALQSHHDEVQRHLATCGEQAAEVASANQQLASILQQIDALE